MKEIKDIIRLYRQIDTATHKVALATVVNVAGSSYRRAGARMLIQDNGVWTGGISGGCLEGDALRKANHCIARNRVDLVRYDTTNNDEEQIGVGLGCEGVIDVLLSPIDPADPNNPVNVLEACADTREDLCLLTVIRSGSATFTPGSMFRYEDNLPLPAAAKTDARAALVSGQSVVKKYDDLEVFIEILQPAINVVLLGSGYDIYPLLQIGNELGWNMAVAAGPAAVTAKMKALCQHIYDKNAPIPVDPYTAFVLMAHDYETDKNNLLRAFDSQVPYIGMLGPRKRREKTLAELRHNGRQISERELNRLYNPVGLDIGATTPEEIALAVLAEIRAHFTGKQGGVLRDKEGPIHARA